MADPVVKWVGGKRQLLETIKINMPDSYGTYYEPFLGGGALFFDLCPKHAVINDLNEQLVNVYRQIKEKPLEVISFIEQFQNSYNEKQTDEEKTAVFYELREVFNSFITQKVFCTESAAVLIFLNKAGFNGLYRVNSSGLYNVPSAHKKKLNCFDKDNILSVSEALKETDILCGDFEAACSGAKKGDFVFFDSPYFAVFDSYQPDGFSTYDHERLYKLFKRLSEKGVYCMLTNSNTDFIKHHYSRYKQKVVNVKRFVNSDAKGRTGKEIIITNY